MGLNEIVQIGNRIRELRSQKGITQKKMSELTKIPYTTYSNYENNNRTPSVEALQKICDVLNITVNELMYNPELHRAKFVGITDPTNPPHFTMPANNNHSVDANEEQVRFEWITERINCGKKLTPEESEFRMYYLEKIIKNVGELFAKPYSLLNEEGKKEADKQIDQALKQVILLTKIPEYQKKNEE